MKALISSFLLVVAISLCAENCTITMPVITDISPMELKASSVSQIVIIRGVNFTTSTQIKFTLKSNGNITIVNPTFVSSTELRLNMHINAVSEWEVTALQGAYESLSSGLSVTTGTNITYSIGYGAGLGGHIVDYRDQNGPRYQKKVLNYTNAQNPIWTPIAVPEEGYRFDVWSDGFPSPDRGFPSENVDAQWTAYFVPLNYSVSYSTHSGGRIDGVVSQSVDFGCDGMLVEAIPESGYAFAGWSDGTTMNPRLDSNVRSNIAVTALFEPLYAFTVEYFAMDHGHIDGPSLQYIQQSGANGSAVTAVPDSGYYFLGWSDGLTEATRMEFGVDQNLVLTAQFEKEQTFNLNLFRGWNLISLPLDPYEHHINRLFVDESGSVISNMFLVSQPRRPERTDQIEALRGYWVYSKRNATITLTGKKVVAGNGVQKDYGTDTMYTILNGGCNVWGVIDQRPVPHDLIVWWFDAKRGIQRPLANGAEMLPGVGYYIFAQSPNVFWFSQ